MTVLAITLTVSAFFLCANHVTKQASHHRVWSRRLEAMCADC